MWPTNPLFVSADSSVNPSHFDDIEAGVNYWNGYFQNTGQTEMFIWVGGAFTGDIVLSNSEAIPEEADAESTISSNGSGPTAIRSGVFNNATNLQYVIAHEIGHHAGFDDVYDGDCSSADTVMKSPWSGGMPSLTWEDELAAQASYPQPPPPPDPYSWQCDWTCGPSPIILPFTRFYPPLTAPDVTFDIRNDGHPPTIGWTAPYTESAFLVLDRDGDGAISKGAELFGNFTPIGPDLTGPRAFHGFAALAWFDRAEALGNDNGMIDPSDAVFAKLRLWVDRNHDGVSAPDELTTLADKGVTWISVQARPWGREDGHGNRFVYAAPFGVTRGSRTHVRMAFDVYFAVSH